LSLNPEKPEMPISATSADKRPQNRFSLLSHDLRSALSDILGGIQLVDSARLDEETRSHFERITASGEVLARLLDRTLTDDLPEEAATLTSPTNLNLSEFLGDIRKRWTARAREKSIGFSIEASPSLPAIVTLDRVALERVIANLLGNAIKFTDRGQVSLSVSCAADKTLCFRVRDDGPGLSAEARARLFEYEGRPPTTAKPGSGLGLFIAKELSELMAAELSVTNHADGGVEALLRLPHAAWFDRSLRRKQTPPADDAPVDLTGLRILLAEDNKTNQLVATQMLRAMGAEYSVASDGLEALEILERERFDLALLDIEMPRMTGLELIRAVRAKPEPLGTMPLVALTAYVMREHRERIFASGADGIIAKPVMSISELGRAILGYLQGQQQRQGATAAPDDETSPAIGEVVNRQTFDALVDIIGKDSAGELLAKLQADTDTVAEGLGLGRKNLDLSEIRSQTHILISVAGAVGAQRLQFLAQRLNAAANRDAAPEIDALCGECLSGLAELQGFILEEQAKVDVPA
jgi:two-component system, OmpR family, aerobic respiration control sensor histidine kinase ArcB